VLVDREGSQQQRSKRWSTGWRKASVRRRFRSTSRTQMGRSTRGFCALIRRKCALCLRTQMRQRRSLMSALCRSAPCKDTQVDDTVYKCHGILFESPDNIQIWSALLLAVQTMSSAPQLQLVEHTTTDQPTSNTNLV
jgi:hypothetical protein